MKKFAMLMLLVGLFSYTVGCGDVEEPVTPADPAPAVDEDGEVTDTEIEVETDETPAE